MNENEKMIIELINALEYEREKSPKPSVSGATFLQRAKALAATFPEKSEARKQHAAQAIVEYGDIIIRVPIKNLQTILDGSAIYSGSDIEYWRICDSKEFAEDICLIINGEDDEGTTMFHRMFDAAMVEAIDDGSLGIERIETVNE